MATKTTGNIYRTMQGKEIDMGKLIQQNEMSVAVGNMKVNARGDLLGNGGKIVKTREELAAEKAQANDATGGV
jgi:hypothetical protein